MNIIKNKGPILILTAACLWAFDGILRRYLHSNPPLVIIFIEHLIGLLILTPFIFKDIINTRLNTTDIRMLFVVSILSGLLGTLFFTSALLKVGLISFSVVFLIQKLQPIFAIGSSAVFLKERLTKKYFMFAILALISCYFLTFPNGIVSFKNEKDTIIACLYAFFAAFAWGTSTTFSKMILNSISYKISVFYRFFLTTLISFIAIVITNYLKVLPKAFSSIININNIEIPSILIFIIITLSTGMVSLVIYYRGLSNVSVKVSAILELFFPLVAIFIDVFLYDSILSPVQIISGILLLFFMYKITSIDKYDIKNKTN